MSIFELDASVKELRELQALIDEANAQIEAIKDKIKLKMVDDGTEVLQGNGWKATWHTVTSSRLDSKALKAAYPELVAQYSKPSTTTRFTLAYEKPLVQALESTCTRSLNHPGGVVRIIPHTPPQVKNMEDITMIDTKALFNVKEEVVTV